MKPSGCKNITVVGNQIHTTFFSALKLVKKQAFDWTVKLQIFLSSLPITFHQIITNLLAEGCDLGPAPFYRSNSNMTPLGQRQHQHPDRTLHETLTSETAPSRVLHCSHFNITFLFLYRSNPTLSPSVSHSRQHNTESILHHCSQHTLLSRLPYLSSVAPQPPTPTSRPSTPHNETPVSVRKLRDTLL